MTSPQAQNTFFLSGRPEEGTQTNYFRPKEVTEIVFPDVGMIMHPLFWVKYGIYLERNGYDLSSQSHLYLWADKNGEHHPTEGLLYYSLLGKHWAETNNEPGVSVGENAAREWLFEPSPRTGHGPYDELYEHFQQAAAGDDTSLSSLMEFTEETRRLMSQRFRSICAEQGVAFDSLFAERLRGEPFDESADETAYYRGIVSAFVRAVVDAFEQAPQLHRKRLGENVIGSNIAFTRPLLDVAPTETLDRLANTEFRFTATEATAFLEAVQARERGEYLVGSILLIATVGPFRETNAVLSDLRQLPQLYDSHEDIISTALGAFPEASFGPAVREALQHLSYFWSVNYFLADGEDLARALLAQQDRTVTQADIEALFADKDTADTFEEFLELSTQEQYARELSGLVELLEEIGESEVASLLRSLEKLLGEGRATTDIFVALLEDRETIMHDGDHYRVTAPIQDNDSAGFYGVTEVLSWTQTLVAARKHE